MQLNQFTDIGLRVLMYLASSEREEPIKIDEIASQFAIPRNHLTKVVNRLSRLGWIRAQRGPGGGLRIGENSKSLKIGNVIRELEGTGPLIDCDGLGCSLRPGCHLKNFLNLGMLAFYETMDRYTLADIIAAPMGARIVAMHHSRPEKLGAVPMAK